MSSLPLEVHEVLEEEYHLKYDDSLPAVAYQQFTVVDAGWACSILKTCGFADVKPSTVDAKLAEIVNGHADVGALSRSPVIGSSGSKLLADFLKGRYADEDQRRVRRRVIDDALCGAIKSLRDDRLAIVYKRLHAKNDDEARTALCISGGGIRSATFALGLLQGFASGGILEKFHYLSTVSGGGYIGSWLSSWSRRHADGVAGVQSALAEADTGIKRTKPAVLPTVDPEPAPVRHLRDYSNYLSPRLGLTSGDTWTMIALYLRNLLLNLLVIVPILAAILTVPRLFAMLLHESAPWQPTTPLWAMLVFLTLGFAYIGFARPVVSGRSRARYKGDPNSAFILGAIVPFIGAGMSLAAYWAKAANPGGVVHLPQMFVWLTAGVMLLVPFVIYYVRYVGVSAAARKEGVTRQGSSHVLWKIGAEAVASVTGVATAFALLALAAVKLFPDPRGGAKWLHGTLPFLRPLIDATPHAQLYLCLAVPVFLLILFVQASVFVGLSSRRNEDEDREWWGRAGAWLLLSAVVIGALDAITIFGPTFLYRAPIILSSIGGVSGIAAALFGFSSKTAATGKEKEHEGKTKAAAPMNALSVLAVPLFVVVALAAIALGTTWLIQRVDDKLVPPEPFLRQVRYDSQFTSSATAKETFGHDGRSYEVKRESPKSGIVTTADVYAYAHMKTIEQTHPMHLAVIVGLAVGAFILSRFIGVNKFSMHALYRNRLIRAYLGASRYNRDPDRFTGFDEHDNLQMYELHPELVWVTTFDVETFRKGFGDALDGKKTPTSKKVADALWARLTRNARKALRAVELVHNDIRDEVIQQINAMLLEDDLSKIDGSTAAGIALRARRNRRILAAHFGGIADPRPMPLHVVNTALNLVSGDNLAWQQRKAESFTFSPLHAGSLFVGYRDAHKYGGPDGVSVGTAVTISGAAASPNMGYHSSPALAFLLTMFNVRLGWWLGNPGPAGRRTYDKGHPNSNVPLLFNELRGNTNDRYAWVYLSDGGHFENLGLYEMVLRRCRFIVVSDGGADPTYNFEDLGNAIRKIRTDLGVPIDVPRGEFSPRDADGKLRKGNYVVTAPIRYSAVDGDDSKDGVLVYIKAGIYDDEHLPKDVYNYMQQSPEFPHEPTSDQFFSESQFESYRALGRHVVNQISGAYSNVPRIYGSVASFVQTLDPTPNVAEKSLRVESMTLLGEDIHLTLRPQAPNA